MGIFKKVGKWLSYIFEFMHSPFTVISKEVDGEVDYGKTDPTKESKK